MKICPCVSKSWGLSLDTPSLQPFHSSLHHLALIFFLSLLTPLSTSWGCLSVLVFIWHILRYISTHTCTHGLPDEASLQFIRPLYCSATLNPHSCCFKSWEWLKSHSELKTRCSVVLAFLKHLSISSQYLKIDLCLCLLISWTRWLSCVKWECWGSVSQKAVVDIQWSNDRGALHGQQVHDRSRRILLWASGNTIMQFSTSPSFVIQSASN